MKMFGYMLVLLITLVVCLSILSNSVASILEADGERQVNYAIARSIDAGTRAVNLNTWLALGMVLVGFVGSVVGVWGLVTSRIQAVSSRNLHLLPTEQSHQNQVFIITSAPWTDGFACLPDVGDRQKQYILPVETHLQD